MKRSNAEIDSLLAAHIAQRDFPSAVYLVAEGGAIVFANALGDAIRAPAYRAARLDTIYDLASLTKPLVTSLLVAQFIEDGALRLGTLASRDLPKFRGTHAENITIRELLTHAAGLPAWRPLYAVSAPDAQSVLRYIAANAGEHAPGARVVYSDLGFIALGFLLERLAAMPLAELAARRIFEPLALRRTFFNPPLALRDEIAASETGNAYERQMCRDIEAAQGFDAWRDEVIRGEVHDGNAHFLGGAAGHAGLFSTAAETLRLATQFIAASTQLLAPATCEMFKKNLTRGLNEARSAGWQLAATPGSTAGDELPLNAFGHTGFAGASLWIDAERARVLILLTNRTHDRALPFVNINSVRRRFHNLAVEGLDARLASKRS